MMTEYATAAIALFLFGAMGGCLVMIRLAIHREPKDAAVSASDRVTSGARVVNGLHVRRTARLYEPAYRRHDLPPASGGEWQEWQGPR
jgi:hypothetical protein